MQVIKKQSHVRKLVAVYNIVENKIWFRATDDKKFSYILMDSIIAVSNESIDTLAARSDIRPIYEGDEITIKF